MSLYFSDSLSSKKKQNLKTKHTIISLPSIMLKDDFKKENEKDRVILAYQLMDT